MNDVEERRLKNLVYELKNMRNEILGTDYYNTANDVYSLDTVTCRDMVRAYSKVKKDRNFWFALCVVNSIIFVVRMLIETFS